MLLISHSAKGWSLRAGLFHVQCRLSASPANSVLWPLCCKEHVLDAAHVIVDYSGEDLTKLSICLGNFRIQYYLQSFPAGGASENQLLRVDVIIFLLISKWP